MAYPYPIQADPHRCGSAPFVPEFDERGNLHSCGGPQPFPLPGCDPNAWMSNAESDYYLETQQYRDPYAKLDGGKAPLNNFDETRKYDYVGDDAHPFGATFPSSSRNQLFPRSSGSLAWPTDLAEGFRGDDGAVGASPGCWFHGHRLLLAGLALVGLYAYYTKK